MHDVMVIGVVLQYKPVVRGKGKGMSEAPIPRKNRTPRRGVEVDKQVRPLAGRFPVGSVPTEEQHRLIPR